MSYQTHRVTGAAAVATLTDLGLSSIAAGVLARRRPVMRLLERTQADARASRRMHLLRSRYGRGPVEVVLPGRRIIVVLDPEDVGQVLADAPTPFHPANREKRKALQWFQPRGVLFSRGPIRRQRREFNETVLQTDSEVHRLAPHFAAVIAEEARELTTRAAESRQLDSSQFMTVWWRVVRRLAFGDAARDDEEITDQLLRLRKAGNWSFLALPHYRERSRFLDHLYRYAEDPQPGTLVSAVGETRAPGGVDQVGQMPQWLFAFDAAGMASLRALALLASHPEELKRAIEDAADPEDPALRPYLRASVLESVRLWPTTPAILRDTTEVTTWREGSDRFTIDKGAGLVIVVPAFHRDGQLLPYAHQFVPDIWLDGRAVQQPQLVPFSAGPAECPGRNLVLLATSTLLAHLLDTVELRLTSMPRLSPDKPLPLTLNQLTLEFDVQPKHSAQRAAASN
ncbi:cytochrome P450 [Mycolicibacterium hippocampi]|uniref:Cytochrome P450 monooxygenase n=1 Tax=Mycolicibacterium hippocampi TaxID=659824 RepID=A0A7I9ZI75_9MYCO|nr:cytochrome P450 [Mycolicibacterium hippocampi]GFH00546.1 cytochrome P450 monooxygenase [Mycolicibacterium hippocampi]